MAQEETRQILRDGGYKLLISAEQIREKVREMGQAIARDYEGRCPILIGVLNGSFIFMADLVRAMDIDCEVDFIKISSYGNRTVSSGTVRIRKDIDAHIEGRHVLVVEDIVDSGRSVQFLKKRLEQLNPASMKFVALFVKEGAARVAYQVDYVGFTIPNEFVIGYGLDFAQRFRNLPAIYVMRRNGAA